MSRRRNEVYDKEYALLENAAKALDGDPDLETLRLACRQLTTGYEKLLRQTEKITRVGDSIQRKLVKAREEIEEKNRELVAAQQRLVRKEKMLAVNTLVAGVAHELLNPLNFVNNLSSMQAELAGELNDRFCDHPPDAGSWEDAKADLEDLAEGAQIIHEHGSRANAIVTRMNRLSRENPGRPHPTDLNLLLQSYTEQVRASRLEQCPLEELDICEELDPDMGEVELVPGDIGFVYTQLLANALESMQARQEKEPGYLPALYLGTCRSRDEVVFTLRDNGPGVAEKDLGKLFTPFFTTKPTPLGHVGLGLFTSYDIIVHGYGGHIDHCLTAKGFTEFSVTLPLQKADQSPAN
ncbi:MAG: ATP-binding protein [Acidobacteriota bacterium]|nr:ATP-binding protein [Acidobacteriota bacterium]